MKILRLIFFLTVTLPLLSFDFDPAEGWFKAGSKPKSYDMGIDKGAGPDGKNAASIKSIDKKIKGFGTLMQNFKPGKYLGKKIRLTGFLKSSEVAQWSGLWLRVDGSSSKSSLSFDNMSDRPIKGTTGWTRCEIVLKVPEGATNIAFGALLVGTGQIWFDDLNFEIIEDSTPGTEKRKEEPSNLNFDK